MVDEILTFSRLEAGRESVVFETADGAAIARETAALSADAQALLDQWSRAGWLHAQAEGGSR